MPTARIASTMPLPLLFRRSRRRRGVILMVVLALLTIFEIVGLTFVAYSEKEATASRNWRLARWPVATATVELTDEFQDDFRRLFQGELDFSASLKAADALESAVREAKAEVLAALANETDPQERERLLALCETLQEMLEKIKLFRALVFEIQFGE
ncbi:MAG TPA: hypothetical protein VFB96_03095 [Pirellulaceae bacterium]|nr:hypothetical protein [Pirellulaceae bacterium]